MRFSLFAAIAGFALNTAALSQAAAPNQTHAQAAFDRLLRLSDQGQLKTAIAKKWAVGDAKSFAEIGSFGTINRPQKVRMIDADHAVTRAQLFREDQPVSDTYFYLTRSGGTWQWSALRSTVLPWTLRQQSEQLRAKPVLTTAESQTLANARLTFALDRDLRRHFHNQRLRFDRLRRLVKTNDKAAPAAARALGLSEVIQDKEPNLNFVIGGIEGNKLGYMYAPTNKPPQISPTEYIWVEKITDKWYLYRMGTGV